MAKFSTLILSAFAVIFASASFAGDSTDPAAPRKEFRQRRDYPVSYTHLSPVSFLPEKTAAASAGFVLLSFGARHPGKPPVQHGEQTAAGQPVSIRRHDYRWACGPAGDAGFATSVGRLRHFLNRHTAPAVFFISITTASDFFAHCHPLRGTRVA